MSFLAWMGGAVGSPKRMSSGAWVRLLTARASPRRMYDDGRANWAAATALPSRAASVVLVFLAALQSVLTSGMVGDAASLHHTPSHPGSVRFARVDRRDATMHVMCVGPSMNGGDPLTSSLCACAQVFGWAPLQLMLEEEGIYGNLCPGGVGPCPAQAARLRNVYTLATSAFCFCVWPTGIVLDRFGPRVCCMMGAVFFGSGCGLMAVSTNELDYFMHGFCLMAIGGLPVVLSVMHLSNLLPEYAGTIITIFNVMIDVSSLNFKLMYVIFNMGVARKDLFLGYCTVPALIFVSAPLLWPSHKYETRQDATGALLSPGGTSQQQAPARRSLMEGRPFMQQATSSHFILCVLFTAFQLLHVNLYIGTVDDQVRERIAGNSTQLLAAGQGTEHQQMYSLGYGPYMAQEAATPGDQVCDHAPPPHDPMSSSMRQSQCHLCEAGLAGDGFGITIALHVALFLSSLLHRPTCLVTSLIKCKSPTQDAQALISQLTGAFAWILPLGGVVMTYPVGWMLDNLSMWQCVFALSFAGLAHSALTLVQGSAVMYASFVLFSYFRAALFGTMATEVAFTFGHENFGKLWGILYCVSGLLNACITQIGKLAIGDAPIPVTMHTGQPTPEPHHLPVKVVNQGVTTFLLADPRFSVSSFAASEEGTFFYINCATLAAGAVLLGYPMWLNASKDSDTEDMSKTSGRPGPVQVQNIARGAIDRYFDPALPALGKCRHGTGNMKFRNGTAILHCLPRARFGWWVIFSARSPPWQ